MNDRTYPIQTEIDLLRIGPSSPTIADSPLTPGTVYIEYHETWERTAEATFDPEVDKRNYKRLGQIPTGRRFRLIEHILEAEQASKERSDLNIYLPGDFSIARLALLAD